jgi:NTP pyrophosphatase (non-canonical NTP hydrolase)
MALDNEFELITARIYRANERYGALASSHEGLGVALEEWDELREAVKANDMGRIRDECLDLAAVLVRMANQISTNDQTRLRSTK